MSDLPKSTDKQGKLDKQAKLAVDWKRVYSEYRDLMLNPGNADEDCGLERDVVRLFKESFDAGVYEDRIPLSETDSVVYEMALKYGRADIVVFHTDGSASVIEVKDGTRGYSHVVAGIGQAALYAAQIAMTKGAVTRVRKCLLWTSAGDVSVDSVIGVACEQAGVVPMPWPAMKCLLSAKAAVTKVLQEGN